RQSVYLNYSEIGYFSRQAPWLEIIRQAPWLDITTTSNFNNDTNAHNFNSSNPYNPSTIPNNLLLLSFESMILLYKEDDNTVKATMISNDYTTYIKKFDSEFTLEQVHFLLNLGRVYFITFNPIIVNDDNDFTYKTYKLELNL